MESQKLDAAKTREIVDQYWDSWYVAGLSDFIRVPNLTPMVDPDYLTNGLVEQAMTLVDDYINKMDIQRIHKKIF